MNSGGATALEVWAKSVGGGIVEIYRLDDWPMRYGLEPAPFRQMKAAVMELFEKLERAGGFD